MSARLTAVLIALVIFVTGAVPAVAGFRCVMTGMRMEVQSACCQHRNAEDVPAFKARCCEPYSAPQLDTRGTPPAPEILIHAPSLAAWVLLPPITPVLYSPDLASATWARGRPPGEQLHLFSSILRV